VINRLRRVSSINCKARWNSGLRSRFSGDGMLRILMDRIRKGNGK
jgi:hypothetical protein